MRYEFSECVLDTERRELRRAGRPVPLRAKSMQVLVYLVEHCERVVTKEELFEQLWAGRVVGDATLNSCLKEVRRAVGDTGRTQDIVRTLHGQGYRFVAALASATPPTGAGGASVRDAPPAGARDSTRAPAAPAASREHKQVSVLACALADAGAHAAALGVEGMDDAMAGA
jgi:DNA-binding winged helix-turn-helix (wHTH) protein